jgi:capsular polysaccharide transport system permease protein
MTTVVKRGPWKIWKDVIFALFAREIRTGFNDKFGVSWAVINPVLFIFVLSFLRSKIAGGETHTIPTFTFMAIGILFIQSFLQTLNASAVSIRKTKALFAFRQVQPISATIAAGLFELMIKTFALMGILLLMYIMGLEIQVGNPILLVACFVLLWLYAVALGLFFGIAELFIGEVRKVRDMASRPLFFISGSFFSLQDMPKEYWKYLDWNPILHAIELARYSAYPTYGYEGVSLGYLGMSTLFTVALSLGLYQAFWRQAISR